MFLGGMIGVIGWDEDFVMRMKCGVWDFVIEVGDFVVVCTICGVLG